MDLIKLILFIIFSSSINLSINQCSVVVVDNNHGGGGDKNNNDDDKKQAIILPLNDRTKSTISIIKTNSDHHHQRDDKIDPNEQAIILHEIHKHHHNDQHPNLPHKIIIEEEDDDNDHDDDEIIDEITPPMTYIKERESYVHHHQQQPEIVQFSHQPNGYGTPKSPILVHLVAPNIRRKHDNGIPDLLAILAPLAAIPLIGSLAVSSFTTMLTLTGLGRRRRKRSLSLHDNVLNFLNSTINDQSSSTTTFDNFKNLTNHSSINYPWNGTTFNNNDNNDPKNQDNQTRIVPISELFQLDIVQQYLRQSGRPDHNDEIIASYLSCRGMFSNSNNCLERLACHYADYKNGRLRPLERDVAALIIYSLLRNSHIDNQFKRRLQRAALFGYDHTTTSSFSSGTSSSLNDQEPSFVAVCDREFPCPRNEMP